VLVMPRESTAWPTAQALWITARGWAEAAEQRLGAAWIVTPDGIWDPRQVPAAAAPTAVGRRPRALPIVLRTLAKDLRLRRRQRRFRVPATGPWSDSQVALVWEHHDLFNRAGRRFATAAGAPLVRYVHAPQVWEAAKWGVRRPLWGRLLAAGERRLLGDADLVACVSTTVRDRLLSMGIHPARLLVAPMGVDADVFSPLGDTARGRLGIPSSAVVVGWCGSFRPFHGLDRLLAGFAYAARSVPELHLLLLGDGPSRGALETLAAELGITGRVTFAGLQPHAEMPQHLRAMDVAIVSSDGLGGFHYSPLKLREYAACGLPVVAPNEGELAELGDAGFLTLHQPGSRAGLTDAILSLAGDAPSRERCGAAARAHVLSHWTWCVQLDRVLARLADLELGPAAR
jgi:glycosyltransferase involved in cell wall biosynthesis